jgi:hypothetical protein
MIAVDNLPVRTKIEVADIFRLYINDYRARYKMPKAHLKVVSDILNCRTAYLGGHVERCNACGAERVAYNSCRNRHCPKCQCLTKERWLCARRAELLPLRYFHVIFTLPHVLNPVVLTNKRKMLNILFQAASETLLTFGKNQENGLCGMLGMTAVLHTWDQLLRDHFHLHILVPAGALSDDKRHWIECKGEFLFPVKALSSVFREKFMGNLNSAFAQNELLFPGQTKTLGTREGFNELIQRCYAENWVVYTKKPIDRPEYVLDYLGRYTHRVAISNNRIVAIEEGTVRFNYKNRDTGEIKEERLDAVEFIRRFLLHVLPKGFMRIRHFGFLANRCKKDNVRICRELLGQSGKLFETVKESIQEVMLRLAGVDITQCPFCGKGTMVAVMEIQKGMGPNAFHLLHPP